MKITFAEEGWSEYLYWQTQDKKILKLPFRKSVPTAYFPKFGEYLYIFLFFVQFEQLYLGFCLLNIEKI